MTTYKQAELDDGKKEAFVWKLKLQKQKEEGTLDKNWKTNLKRTRKDNEKEIMEVRARKQKREEERERMEKEREEQRRLEEQEAAEEWERKGEEFAVTQLRIRRDQRLAAGRAKPVDLLFKNLEYLQCQDTNLMKIVHAPEIRDPYKVVNDKHLSLTELTELRNDTEALLTYLKTGVEREWWEAVRVLVDDATLSALRKHQEDDSGIHSAVYKKVLQALEKKKLSELDEMEKQMQRTVQTGGKGVDVEYWSTLLKKLQVFKARAYLKEKHVIVLKKYTEKLEREKEAMGDLEQQKPSQWEEQPADFDLEESGGESEDLSPTLHQRGEDEYVETEAEASAVRLKKRVMTIQQEKAVEKVNNKYAEQMGVSTRLDDGEARFSDEISLQVGTKKSWHDKWRPRRPNYYNTVHTGYEWNKYNSTHYDYDNPPPKVVMGYKFNIFYPDLVDQYQQPTYYVEPTDKGWDDDTCIIRFHAGPPYEDVAFKIVNREWEYSGRRGFRCTFERGILHLYFNFVRYRYRR